jgi:2-dehydropantoate 2-reductase
MTASPQLLIVGPGALGMLFAARLGRRWSGLHLLDHREDRASRLQDTGLHVAGVTMLDWTPPPARVRAFARGWPVMDAAYFFVKAPAFPAALAAAAPVIGPKTALVVFSESVDVTALKARRQAVAALADDRARSEGLGRTFHEAAGGVRLDAAAPLAKAAASYLKEAGVPVALDPKLLDKRWATLLAQVCVDVPAALTDTPQKSVLAPPLAELADGLLNECAAVSKAARRPVAAAALRKLRDDLVARAPDAKSPLGRDLLRGRPTERAALLDPLLAAAKKGRVAAPILSAMDRLLRRLEKESLRP